MKSIKLEYKWLVATAFVFGIFMDLMDITVVNVALPTLGRHFHASNASLEWVVTGYLLSLAIWIPASGWIGDQIGTKKVFVFALAILFTLLLVREERQPNEGAFDVPGFVLSGAGLALVLFALSRGPEAGWGSLVVVSTGVIGVVLFAGLVVTELRSRAPLLHLRLL